MAGPTAPGGVKLNLSEPRHFEQVVQKALEVSARGGGFPQSCDNMEKCIEIVCRQIGRAPQTPNIAGFWARYTAASTRFSGNSVGYLNHLLITTFPGSFCGGPMVPQAQKVRESSAATQKVSPPKPSTSCNYTMVPPATSWTIAGALGLLGLSAIAITGAATAVFSFTLRSFEESYKNKGQYPGA